MFEPLTEKAQEVILREVPLIEEALLRIYEVLDLSSQECESCKHEKMTSFGDHQLAENLRSIRQKMRRWEESAGGRGATHERAWRNRQTQRV